MSRHIFFVHLCVLVWQLDRSDDQVVLLVRGVRAKDQSVDRVVLALRPGHVREPLGCQTRPFLRQRNLMLIT